MTSLETHPIAHLRAAEVLGWLAHEILNVDGDEAAHLSADLVVAAARLRAVIA